MAFKNITIPVFGAVAKAEWNWTHSSSDYKADIEAAKSLNEIYE